MKVFRFLQERVEVLRSFAQYGSDAIAGVNIILKNKLTTLK
jgi:outer membrane receptor for ferrienterochelin and colicin